MVHLDPDGNLRTSLYSKPTDRNAYLHHSSYHPPNQIKNIPYGQFLRVKKLCSNQPDAEEGMNQLAKKFVERGFPRDLIEEQQKRTNLVNRSDLLNDKKKTGSARTPFSTTYNRNHPPIRKIINTHWHLLNTNKKNADAFAEKPVVAFRRNRNLREILGQVHVSRGRKLIKKPRSKRHTGSTACLSTTKNLCCKHLVSTKTFSSDTTGEVLEILHSLNCKSKNIIYLGHCALCRNTQYVGKSEPPAHLRINTHRQGVKDPNGGAFDQHFNLPGHNFNDHAKFTIIEQIRNHHENSKAENRRQLEAREDFWMLRLKTLKPSGLNDSLNSGTRQRLLNICA